MKQRNRRNLCKSRQRSVPASLRVEEVREESHQIVPCTEDAQLLVRDGLVDNASVVRVLLARALDRSDQPLDIYYGSVSTEQNELSEETSGSGFASRTVTCRVLTHGSGCSDGYCCCYEIRYKVESNAHKSDEAVIALSIDSYRIKSSGSAQHDLFLNGKSAHDALRKGNDVDASIIGARISVKGERKFVANAPSNVPAHSKKQHAIRRKELSVGSVVPSGLVSQLPKLKSRKHEKVRCSGLQKDINTSLGVHRNVPSLPHTRKSVPIGGIAAMQGCERQESCQREKAISATESTTYSMSLSLLERPSTEGMGYIVSARDLLLCRDDSYGCSPYVFAVLFDQICASEDGDPALDRIAVPTHDDIAQSPDKFAQFLVARALRSKALGHVLKELFVALADTYLTLDSQNELESIGSFIKTCFVKSASIPDMTIKPVVGSSLITRVEYWEPNLPTLSFERKSEYVELIVEEQCDFKVGIGDKEDSASARLRVEYAIRGSKKGKFLFNLSTRRVEIALLDEHGCELPHLQGSRCLWTSAYKNVKKFYVCSYPQPQKSTSLVFSTCRIQPRNDLYFTRRVFANNHRDLVGNLLKSLLGKLKSELGLTYGRTSVSRSWVGMAAMYRVISRVVICVGSQACGAEVMYRITNNSGASSLFMGTVNIWELHGSHHGTYSEFLQGVSNDNDADVTLTLKCRAVLNSTELLEDVKNLADSSKTNDLADSTQETADAENIVRQDSEWTGSEATRCPDSPSLHTVQEGHTELHVSRGT
ncbi:hypothetical protein, partial [Candidatus Anaplasma sp. TIGMIC]|uniref:hypothetical protein n=1 Tax=Candidatus Anaplasma sp. TIGMIC TaxID=3020713 RepID=UPI00232AB63D